MLEAQSQDETFLLKHNYCKLDVIWVTVQNSEHTVKHTEKQWKPRVCLTSSRYQELVLQIYSYLSYCSEETADKVFK